MEEAAKKRFKWKFYLLSLELNLIVLLVALAVVAFFKAPPTWNVLLMAALLVMAAVLGLYFRKDYNKTNRGWTPSRNQQCGGTRGAGKDAG